MTAYAGIIVTGLEQYTFLAGCGEFWGHALMCLAFWKAYRKSNSMTVTRPLFTSQWNFELPP